MTTSKSATVYIFVLAAIALIGVIVLLCINKNVPTELWAALTLLIGGGLGISQPAVTTTAPAPVVATQVTPQPGTVPTGSAG